MKKAITLLILASLILSAGCSTNGGATTEKESETTVAGIEETTAEDTTVAEETTSAPKVGIHEKYLRDPEDDSLIYTGYLMEYDITSSLYPDTVFPFEIKLPSIVGEDDWNNAIAGRIFGINSEYIAASEEGENHDITLSVTYQTVDVGDITTIAIRYKAGMIGTDAANSSYEIYHYDRSGRRFLTDDEVLEILTVGKYNMDSVLETVNRVGYSVGEDGSISTVTMSDICGIIPSVFGGESFDLCFYTESGQTNRLLFAEYPVYRDEKNIYSFVLKYNYPESIEESGGSYTLLLGIRSEEDMYSTGIPADSDIRENIISNAKIMTGGKDNKYHYIKFSETVGDGSVERSFRFELPESAEELYDMISTGENSIPYIKTMLNIRDNIAQNIAEDIGSGIGSILDAFRKNEKPTNILPNSESSIQEYPESSVRDNPEIEEICRITCKAEKGTDCLIIKMPIGENNVMKLLLKIEKTDGKNGISIYYAGFESLNLESEEQS